ncbi:aspartate aminotransferase [Fusarium circinatum]|uniref:Aspartate aminotransferase n=1 Tax=Fusarium circinatum TaxID=48490 RepID=A0A8H5X3L8_FUSCI|nr:aspartate aminotransferase [Fusarium circinatum]
MVAYDYYPGSSAGSHSIDSLKGLTPDSTRDPIDRSLALTYGKSLGFDSLRKRIAELHSSKEVTLTTSNAVITSGSISANYLALSTVLNSGDHVICQYPTYGQIYELPKHFGIEVSLWKSTAERNWIPDLKDLASLVRPNTKAILITNPCNPTGTVLRRDMLDGIITVAKQHHLILFADEVFRPLFHSPNEEHPPSVVAMGYQKTICTSSLSKAHGLSGIRVGWVVSPDPQIIKQIVVARDYTTVSVSQLDQCVAMFALSPEVLPRLMDVNLERCAKGIALLDAFVRENSKWCQWVPPAGAGVGFIRICKENEDPVDDADFCGRLASERGICVVPAGHSFTGDDKDDLKGYVRLPLGDWQELEQGLQVVANFLASYMAKT